MQKQLAWLLNYKSDTFSQAGEDGIIEKILEIIPETDSWCVEFGAWDGIHFSNTRNLVINKNYRAVLIEADQKKFIELQENCLQYPNVILIHKFVGFSRSDNLDQILSKTPVPETFDFLSIDIDGNDYYVWQKTTKYKPKVVCIEFNPTIPNEVNFVQPANPGVNQGASLAAITELGKEKGYELISVLPFNALFVQEKYFSLFKILDNRIETLRQNKEAITYMFTGYDGTIFLRGHRRNNWHDIEINEEKIQILPKFLRKYPHNYNRFEKALFDFLFRKQAKKHLHTKR